MTVSDFKEELSKKILEFQQKLFNVDDLDELKDEIEELKSDLIEIDSQIDDQIDEDNEEEEEEESEEESHNDLDSQINQQEKNLPKGNNSLANEQEQLRRELGL